jgi:hypothetical protein
METTQSDQQVMEHTQELSDLETLTCKRKLVQDQITVESEREKTGSESGET